MLTVLALVALVLAVAYRYGAFGPHLTRSLAAQVRVLLWGIALGALGFAGGFFGPLWLVPDANQGPLLGIFITGPLGFLGGLGWGLWRERARAIERDAG